MNRNISDARINIFTQFQFLFLHDLIKFAQEKQDKYNNNDEATSRVAVSYPMHL